MLPAESRLKKRDDFATVFSKGAYAAFSDISIKFTLNHLPASRLGFPVGKNYSKKAVTRNRTRRILRSACSECLANLKPGYDIIILIKPSYQNIELKKVIIELRKVFSKANLLI